MKRMRFFAIIFTLLIGIVGGNFITPTKVSAQAVYVLPVPESYAPYLSASTDLANIFQGASFQNAYTPAQKSLYASYFGSLKGIMSQNAKDPENKNLTDEVFQVRVLNNFLTYLNGLTSSIADPALLKVNADTVALANSVHTRSSMTPEALAAAGGTAATSQSLTQLQNAAAENVAATQKIGAEPTKKCTLFTGFDLGACLDAGLSWIITHTLLAIAGWVLWITATVMNYSITVGILQFSNWAPDTLYPIWLVIRQIVSLFIVFAGLWLGFMYILNKGEQFKKFIPIVVMFALFVNFSYPLTRAVIDISNVISLNIYTSAVGSAALDTKASGNKTVGTMIMNRLGLSGLVDFATGTDADGKAAEGKLNSINSVPAALLAVIFIFYAAYIFFVVSALIITRTAVLVFLIVASPLLFVDEVIPKLGEAGKKLRGIFCEMLFVGPVFTIMLAITLKFLEVFQDGGPLSQMSQIGESSGDKAITMFFNLLMMLIMLHIMMKVTKSVSGSIGQAVSGVAGGVGKLAVGGVAGLGARAGFAGLGMAGRSTFGRGAAALQQQSWMTKDNAFSRAAFRMTGAVAGSSFDPRNTSFVQTGSKNLGISSGMGTGGKLGYKANLQDKKKDLQMRRGFRSSELKSDYALLDENDAAGRVAFRNNLKGPGDQKLKESLDKEEWSKTLATYKGFSEDSKGQQDRAAFVASQSDKNVKTRLAEYEAKILSDKADREVVRNEGKTTAESLAKIAAKMEGSAPVTTFVNPPQAVNQAITNNVALPGVTAGPTPSVSSMGYPSVPQSGLHSQPNSNYQQNSQTTVSFDVDMFGHGTGAPAAPASTQTRPAATKSNTTPEVATI